MFANSSSNALPKEIIINVIIPYLTFNDVLKLNLVNKDHNNFIATNFHIILRFFSPPGIYLDIKRNTCIKLAALAEEKPLTWTLCSKYLNEAYIESRNRKKRAAAICPPSVSDLRNLLNFQDASPAHEIARAYVLTLFEHEKKDLMRSNLTKLRTQNGILALEDKLITVQEVLLFQDLDSLLKNECEQLYLRKK